MTNASEFLLSRAEAFRFGRFADFSRFIEFPMPFFAGGNVKVMSTRDQVETELAHYREVLDRSGYHHSNFEVLSSEMRDDDHARFDVRCSNMTRHDHLISWSDLSYFLSRGRNDCWVISMIEVLEEKKAFLTAV